MVKRIAFVLFLGMEQDGYFVLLEHNIVSNHHATKRAPCLCRNKLKDSQVITLTQLEQQISYFSLHVYGDCFGIQQV